MRRIELLLARLVPQELGPAQPSAERRVKVDGAEVPFDWRGPQGSHWVAGDRLTLSAANPNTFTWTSYTVDQGAVELYWVGEFARSGAEQAWQWTGRGRVNCFALGWLPLDAEYLLQYLEELGQEKSAALRLA